MMVTRTYGRMGLSILAALVVVLAIVASGFTQSAGQVYLPMIQQGAASIAADAKDDETPPKPPATHRAGSRRLRRRHRLATRDPAVGGAWLRRDRGAKSDDLIGR